MKKATLRLTPLDVQQIATCIIVPGAASEASLFRFATPRQSHYHSERGYDCSRISRVARLSTNVTPSRGHISLNHDLLEYNGKDLVRLLRCHHYTSE